MAAAQGCANGVVKRRSF